MKKNLFLTVLLGVATLFCACKGGEEKPNGGPKLTVKPAEVMLQVEESFRLTVTVEPASAKKDLVFTSSNEEIATVDANGVITAIALGEADVTVKSGELSAVCHVRVVTYLESLSFTGMCVYGYNMPAADADTVHIKDIAGNEFVCNLVDNEVWVMSSGFYVGDDGYLTGEEKGALLTIPAKMYIATKENNPELDGGTIFCLGKWYVSGQIDAETNDKVGRPGYVTDAFVPYLKEALAAVNVYFTTEEGSDEEAAAASAYSGALKNANGEIGGSILNVCTYATFSDGSAGYSNAWIPEALIESGVADISKGAEGASRYMIGLDGYEFNLRPIERGYGEWVAGLAYHPEYSVSGADTTGVQFVLDSEDLQYGAPMTLKGGVIAADEAPVFMPLHVLSEEMPERAAQLKQELMDKHVLIQVKK